MPPTSNLPKLSSEEWRACTSWEYDTSFWQKTIIMDFDLVCDVRPERHYSNNLSTSEVRPQEVTAAGDLPGLDVWSVPQWVDQ